MIKIMKCIHKFENYHDWEGSTPDAKGGGGALVRITLDEENPDYCPVLVRFNLPDGEDLFSLEGTMPREIANKLLNAESRDGVDD